MLDKKRDQRIAQIQTSLEQLSRMLVAVAADQDWRPAPGEWSFREVAAHMKTVEQECHRDRVERIAAGEQPHFTYYLNSDRDFSAFDLAGSLQAWADTRQEIIDFVRTLPAEKLALIGAHDTFGTLTVLDVLREMFNHDQEHIQELAATLKAYRRIK